MRHYWWDFERPRWGWTGWWRQGRKFGEILILILAVLTILTFKWLFLMLKFDSSNLPVKCNIIFQKSLSWISGYYWRRWSIFHCFFEKTSLATKLELKTLFARKRICSILILNLWIPRHLGQRREKEERTRLTQWSWESRNNLIAINQLDWTDLTLDINNKSNSWLASVSLRLFANMKHLIRRKTSW